MTKYNTYTIDGTTYVADGDAIYRVTDVEHGSATVEESQRYLHNDRIVVFDTSFDIINAKLVHGDGDYYPDDDFTATKVERVIPDGIKECPDCGGWLGPEDEDNLMCFDCGYGRPSDDE